MKTYDKHIREGLGERLRKARKDAGLSYGEVTEKTMIQKCQLSGYENGKRSPDIYTISLLSETYGVSIDYLWYGKGKRYFTCRPKPAENEILEALATLYYMKILFCSNGRLVFDAAENGELIDFLKMYDALINDSSSTKYPYTKVTELVDSYAPLLAKYIKQGTEHEDERIIYELRLTKHN